MQRRTFSLTLGFFWVTLCHVRVPFWWLWDNFTALKLKGSTWYPPRSPQRQNGDQTGCSEGWLCTFLDPRATQKEYSGQFGSQNDSKMEVKMEPTPGLWTLTKHAPAWSDCILDPPGELFFHPFSGVTKNSWKSQETRLVSEKKGSKFEEGAEALRQIAKLIFFGAPRKFSRAEKESKWGPMAPWPKKGLLREGRICYPYMPVHVL